MWLPTQLTTKSTCAAGAKKLTKMSSVWQTSVIHPLQVKPYNIGVSVVFPPDTDTPGFENENKHKVNAHPVVACECRRGSGCRFSPPEA